jgi:hypothetical protein
MTVLRTAADQLNDINGSDDQNSNLDIADEPQQLGAPLGPMGSNASIISMNGSELTIVGLSEMTLDSIGCVLQLLDANTPANNGAFTISNYIAPDTVSILNGGGGSAPDANNGNISWIERNPYSLRDDLNYERSDRKIIKGVDYDQLPPTYQQPIAIGTDVPTNLANISGNTLDAIAYLGNRQVFGIDILAGQSFITLFGAGMLKHTDPINTLGIPCFDMAPYVGDFNSCFVKVLDGYVTGAEIQVIQGPHAGERIFGVTSNGSSVSPNSVEIFFYSCPPWQDITIGSSPYTWEVGQPNAINLIYVYNQIGNNLDTNIFILPTLTPASGTGGSGITSSEHETLRQLIHFIDEGPGDGFLSGAYKVILPQSSPFPTSVIWYEDDTMSQIIISKMLVWSGPVPTNIIWQIYNTDGVTVAHTVSDSIAYNNMIFESTRVRTIS